MLNQFWTRSSRLGLTGLAALGLAVPVVARAQTPDQAPPAPRASLTVILGQAATQAATQNGQTTVSLSMDDAVQMALETNLGLKSTRLDLDDAAQGLAQARATFLPRMTTSFSRGTSSNPAQQNPDGTFAVSSSTALNSRASLQQTLPWYGTGYNVSWSARRSETPGSRATFNPSLGSTFQFSITQPLLRNFMTDSSRAQVESSERQQVITDLQVQQAMIQLESQVKTAYLQLVAARENQKVAQANLELTEDALANSRARVEVGVAPQTDILADEAAVASSRVSAIAAEAQIAAAEDNLRRLVLDPSRPDYWSVSLATTDTPELTPREIDLDATIQNALANRLDLEILKRNVDLIDLNMRVSKNATMPDLGLQVDYSASGTGGRRTEGELADRTFGNVLGEAFAGDYPSWTTSVNFSYPIGRTAAKASFARAQIQKQQQLLNQRDLELSIVQQVRAAVRNVQNRARQVEAARAALQASQQNLDAENQKRAVGLSTNLDLQFRQQNLAQARLNELNAIISYNQALIDLDRVQKIR
ncbi:MAG: TolC family protein [Vicinamibacterales bacterium]